MKELLNDEELTTADIVNPTRSQTVAEAETESVADTRNDVRDTRSGVVDTRNRQPLAAATQQPHPNPLFPEDELHGFRSRWDQVQTSFVDEPRAAVEQADSLVANVVKRIAEQFAAEREQLEKQWDRGENVNTEDLRQALKRYRAFFDRLLTF
jgi:hypothetical protein